MQRFKQSGFTLIELIIVIAIIALLAAATFVAVNPAKRIGDANNAQRWSDVTAIADAWMKYVVDNNGTNATSSPSCITHNLNCRIAAYGIGAAASTTGACTASSTLGTIWLDALVSSGYIGAIPRDPSSAIADGTTSTGYYFHKDVNNVVTVGACHTYDSATIKVIR